MFCKGASASGASIRPDRNFPDSCRRPWRLCLWVYAVAFALFRSHMSASEGQDAVVVVVVVVVVRLSPKSCYTMSSCRLVWCGAVGRHLLRRSCKISSSHGFVYARPFSYPGNVQKKKRAQKHTNCVQMTTEEMQLQETHSPPTLPWAHSGFSLRANQNGGDERASRLATSRGLRPNLEVFLVFRKFASVPFHSNMHQAWKAPAACDPKLNSCDVEEALSQVSVWLSAVWYCGWVGGRQNHILWYDQAGPLLPLVAMKIKQNRYF